VAAEAPSSGSGGLAVGFVGLGRMGQGMARNILGAGLDLVVWNRTAEKAQELVDAGARLAGSLAEACAGRDAVVTMVADDAALLDVIEQPGGIGDSLEPGAVHVAMGTHGVRGIASATEAHERRGQAFVAAPVFGRPDVAAAGELTVVPAGPADAVERCRPIFDAVGRRTILGGAAPVGAAAVKLANNFVLGCAIEAMAEAFALLRCYGEDPATLYEVMTQGLFAGSPSYAAYGKMMVEGRYEPGFTVRLALKDVDLMLEAARGVDLPLPSAEVYRDSLDGLAARGDAELDWAAIFEERLRRRGAG